MKRPKFGRGDTIKLLPGTNFPRAAGSLYVIRKVFEYSQLNDTVKGNLADCMTIPEDTPVYYCSDEINYNVFVPESCVVTKCFFFTKEVPCVEAATPMDKMLLRVATIAEAVRKPNHLHQRGGSEDEDV